MRSSCGECEKDNIRNEFKREASATAEGSEKEQLRKRIKLRNMRLHFPHQAMQTPSGRRSRTNDIMAMNRTSTQQETHNRRRRKDYEEFPGNVANFGL